MRTIEEKMVNAIRFNRSRRLGNTYVESHNGLKLVWLHDNLIYREVDDKREINLCGWNSNTTRSRLRALGIDIRQQNYLPVLNGKIISVNGWHEA